MDKAIHLERHTHTRINININIVLDMLSLAPNHLFNPIFSLKCIKQSRRYSIRSSGVRDTPIDTDGGDEEIDIYVNTSKRVVLVRHGESTWNEEGRIQGSSDYSVLTKKGESQAETSRQMLIAELFDVCFASPLARSRRTAEIIWDYRQAEFITDYDLREIDLYSFQGLLKHEGKQTFGEAFLKWQKEAPNFEIDGHYPVRELWARARKSWKRILAHESKYVLVVAHNAVNQALIATALGLGTEYFRILLQSNCGVSVLDFTHPIEDGSPYVCLNRLNQTPNSPVAAGSSGGRKTNKQIVLVCHGSSENDSKDNNSSTVDGQMTMLGEIQSQKTAELLLDLKLSTIVTSPKTASMETANTICRVQEAADCLGADFVPRYVELKQIPDLDFEITLQNSENKGAAKAQSLSRYEDDVTSALMDKVGQAWKFLLKELSAETDAGKIVVAVAPPPVHIALMCHGLNLTKERLGSFHLNDGSISVIDFPEGPSGRGVIRCINYTVHLGRWSIPITRPRTADKNI